MTNNNSRRNRSTLAFLPSMFIPRSNDVHAGEMTYKELESLFKHLNEIGNSNCSIAFMHAHKKGQPRINCLDPLPVQRATVGSFERSEALLDRIKQASSNCCILSK